MKFVVNPGGAVHSVPDEWVDDLLAQGHRLATDEEIAEYYRSQGLEVPGGQGDNGRAHQHVEEAHERERK